MGNIKKIGIFVGVAGAIAVGYYLLKKTKPKVAEKQLSQLNANEKSSIQKDLSVANSTKTEGSGRTSVADTSLGLQPTVTNTTRNSTVNPTYTPTSTTTSTRSTSSTTPRATNSTIRVGGRR